MMNKFKKFLSLGVSAMTLLGSAFGFAACGGEETTVIGVMQYGTHESLNNCYDGIIKGLKENGIDPEADNVKLKYLNDNFDGDTAASHAKTLVNSGADVIVGIATPSAIQAAEASNGEIPVVYCAVTDDAVMSHYTNVCGSSDRPNYEKTLELVTAFMGKTDLKIGVISATSESSDPVMIGDLQTAAKAYADMEIDVKYITDITTITTVTNSMIDKDGVDCFVNLLDNTVVGQLENILAVTNTKQIPVFGSEVEQVVNGCLAASSIDYIEIGRIAGEMAAKILNGTSANTLGSRVISSPVPYYSQKVATSFSLAVPDLVGLVEIGHYTK